MKTAPKTMSLRRRESLWGYIFISPWILGFVLFTVGPMIASLVFSFSDFNIISPPTNWGFSNFIKIFTVDPDFWRSLGITAKYAVVAIPLNLVFGFALAFLLNQKVRGLAVWRTVFYIPSVLAGVAVAILWGLIFNPKYGILNWFLGLLGIHGPGWLSSPDWAVPALILMSLWSVGGGMIIYLSGLQGIPTTLYEASELDGANGWQKFFNITIPLMSPVILYNLVVGIIGTFQYFTEVYVLTSGLTGGIGGPAKSTLFYNVYLYAHAFEFREMGYASALAWILFIIVLMLTLIVFRSSAAWVYYEGELRNK